MVTMTWLCFRRKIKLEGIVLRFLVCEKGVYVLFPGSSPPPSRSVRNKAQDYFSFYPAFSSYSHKIRVSVSELEHHL